MAAKNGHQAAQAKIFYNYIFKVTKQRVYDEIYRYLTKRVLFKVSAPAKF